MLRKNHWPIDGLPKLLFTTFLAMVLSLTSSMSHAQKKPFQINSISFPLIGSTYLDDRPGWPSVATAIQQLKATGANDVKVTVSANHYAKVTDNLPVAGANSFNPSDEKILDFLRQLKSQGLQITLVPFVNIDFNPSGNLLDTVHPAPTDFNVWIGAHTASMVSFARMAQQAGVDRFVVFEDVTQNTLYNPDHAAAWLNLIASVRSVYSGHLTSMGYTDASLFGGGLDHLGLIPAPILSALDSIGFGFHPEPITNTKDATLPQLIAGWRTTARGVNTWDYLTQIHLRYNKPVWISDISFHSFDGDNLNTGDIYDAQKLLTVDEQEQADQYDALFTVLTQNLPDWFLGVSVDSWNRFPANCGGTARFLCSAYGENIQGKLAERVVSQWFSGRRAWGGMEATATASGNNTNLRISTTINASAIDMGLNGSLYVAAFLPDGAIYLRVPGGWVPYTGTALPSYSRGAMGTHTIEVADGTLDVSGLRGTRILVGYGLDESDLLTNKKYLQIYTIE